MIARIFTVRAVATILAIMGPVATSAAQNWPSFRGPQASGVADGSNPPVSWDVGKSKNIVWKTEIPGLAHSSPIVFGDRLFVSTAVSSDPNAVFRHGLFGDVEPSNDLSKHTWKVYCLDRKTGKILWEETAHEGIPKTKRHPKSSQASSTPATDRSPSSARKASILTPSTGSCFGSRISECSMPAGSTTLTMSGEWPVRRSSIRIW